ncbi:MAG TPA: cytochrome c3 family protein [Vicinamibacteria bacterium]|nr:cytochrome c3 family protein [Vicinamibacteria bacterium]
MSQIFHHSTNTLSKLSIFGGLFLVAAALWALLEINRSAWVTRAGDAREQPVPFSHAHHVGGIGLDCRYCHASVEASPVAGMPATEICMGCHAQIWAQSPMLEPVRESFRTDRSIEWVRVHDLPDFSYFDHSAHVNQGVGCSTCHGRVDQMPLMWQEASLQMEWCLECHRNPERYLRPRSEVFDVAYVPPFDQLALGRRLVQEYGVETRTGCSTCHR